MKNTSLRFLGQCQGRPSADPAERKSQSASDHRGVIGDAVWRPLIAYYKYALEHAIMGVTKSENSSLENFPFRNVYYGMRPAKQKKDTKFFVENGVAHFQKENFCSFSHLSWSNTQVRKYGEAEKMQSRVTFPDFSYLLFIYSKSDTPIIYRCGSLRTFVQLCNIDVTFHVKHCKS